MKIKLFTLRRKYYSKANMLPGTSKYLILNLKIIVVSESRWDGSTLEGHLTVSGHLSDHHGTSGRWVYALDIEWPGMFSNIP